MLYVRQSTRTAPQKHVRLHLSFWPRTPTQAFVKRHRMPCFQVCPQLASNRPYGLGFTTRSTCACGPRGESGGATIAMPTSPPDPHGTDAPRTSVSAHGGRSPSMRAVSEIVTQLRCAPSTDKASIEPASSSTCRSAAASTTSSPSSETDLSSGLRNLSRSGRCQLIPRAVVR